MKIIKLLAISTIVAITSGCSITQERVAQPDLPIAMPTQTKEMQLKIATWNVEHLAYPFNTGCKPRTSEDIAAMQAYASSLNANIVALQEVASKAALDTIFPESEWQLIVSDRPDSQAYECRESGFRSTQQKVAFAVRKSLPVLETRHFSALALDNPGLRYGLAIKVLTPLGPTEILNVHMKSGCFVDDYSQSDVEACAVYAKQAPQLAKWIADREAVGQPYLVLGDFNHKLSAPYNRLTRTLTSQNPNLVVTTERLMGCHPRYPAPIDHILLGGTATQSLSTSVQVHPYDKMTEADMLSDHCAISLSLSKPQVNLSSALRWHTRSKEYGLITEGIYQQAQAALDIATFPENWVVVMDVDETILDNTGYQVWLETEGKSYSNKSWFEWVKRQEASLVPVANAFMAKVIEKGGKLALITNRDKSLDSHTWQNLRSLGVNISESNTCLIGRNASDKQAIGEAGIVNDKDLRRQQLIAGKANCFVSGGSSSKSNQSWHQPHSIEMQVGDNIEDLAGVTQEEANADELLPEVGNRIFIVPNALYGSWH